ncbi:V-set and immunoglobulin domain-containing protein 1-like [Asterias rubens]|uniref:V-set and immunoglobulin domain-containing protein 1-like n=1 Tax=Asterias rubens TaxID=7604 RepID=UPI00145517B5|nr:V-set and immunoglobulin domain-containing protein 1-like [Asterias rubens]
MLRVLTTIALFLCTAAEFLTDPRSVTVYEGQNITLTCKSDIFDNGEVCSTYSFYWRKDISLSTDTYFSVCGTVYTQFRERMTVSKNYGDYSLTITHVRSVDSGRYYCYDNSNLESARADLVVLRAPPSCDVTPNPVTVDALAQLVCRLSSETDPASLLTWIYVESGIVVDSTEDPEYSFTADHWVTELDNFKEFACVAGPDLTNGARCVITPLQVQTIVLISPSPSVTVFEGDLATFTCTSESIPSAYEFRWRVSKPNGLEDKVNVNTISNLRGEYSLSDNGQEMGIIRVSIVEFDNAVIRCIAFNGREPAVSSEETILLVLPASERGTTHQPFGTDPLEPDSKADTGSSTGNVVGGVIGVIILLAIIASLACYLLRNKNGSLKQRLGRSKFNKLSSKALPTMSVEQASPTYEEVPQDAVRYHTRNSSDDITEQPALYALPEAAIMQDPETCGPSSPTYANSSGYVNLPRHSDQRPLSGASGADNRRNVSSEEVKYSVLDKSRQNRHSSQPAGETTEGAGQSPDDDRKQKNAEGLVYAELDLENARPASSVENSQHADESINYASIRGDMAAVRSLLSRD